MQASPRRVLLIRRVHFFTAWNGIAGLPNVAVVFLCAVRLSINFGDLSIG
ncbi:hypothetical protein BURCENBC7_AP6138 [Burkholderia cenocepacia BC7]|nr:hypothetical protein BURCENBC7_AP6138 [Burkholderia cenocepacia BC7]